MTIFALKQIKQEILEAQEEHIRERQQHEAVQEQLTREVKLRLLILENFIPPADRVRLEKRTYFDEEAEIWKMKPVVQVDLDGEGDSASE